MDNQRRSRGNLSRADAHRGRALEHKQLSSAELRDIGPPAACSDLELRARVENDLGLFLRTIWPTVFKWPFSDDQEKSLTATDRIVEHGGLQAIADPRGTGKTQRAIRAAIKAIVTGKRRFVCIVAATEKKARGIIKAIKTILCYCALLQDLFPAELHGFQFLKGNNRKAAGQLSEGAETAIEISADKIIFPTIRGSRASGACISACGITGDIRGQFHTLLDGSVIRPDLILLDDPQTKESASSADQTETRLETIEADILGLTGPDTSIACLVLCTVIAPDDLSERLLSDPKWHGTRTKTIYTWPTHLKEWDRYFEDISEAERLNQPELVNQLYIERRDILDAGCQLAWIHRVENGRVSAIQTAMLIYRRVGPTAFSWEYQNETPANYGAKNAPTAKRIATKLIGLSRGVVPRWATKLTAFIDVHLDALFWAMVAWNDDFTGHISDYGIFPEQNRGYVTLADVNPTLRTASGSSQPQGAIRWGLDRLAEKILGTAHPVEHGGTLHVTKCGVDEGYNQAVIHEFVKRSKHGAVLLPCKGFGIRAGDSRIDEYKKNLGTERLGQDWTTKLNEKTKLRFGKIDTNAWKTFVCQRIAAEVGEKGTITIFGERPETHRQILDHCTAEKPVATYRKDGSEVWEWREPVAGADNHWFDCLSNNAALASMSGCSLEHMSTAMDSEPKRRDVVVPDHLRRRRGA